MKKAIKGNFLGHGERGFLVGLIIFLLLAVFINTIHLSANKSFSIDEFQYAHASWLIANGQVPYKDFFEVHFPLLYQYLSPYWLFVDDNPGRIADLRFLMLPFLALGLISIALMADSNEKVISSLLAVTLVLACAHFVAFATELRPDAAAFAFYAAALGVFYISRFSPKIQALLSGIFIVAAFWASQKAWFYGLPFLVAWGLDGFAMIKRRGGGRYILGHPLWLIMGALAGLLPILLYLFATNSWASIYYWCVKWAFEYQQIYPSFSWSRVFLPFLYAYPDYLILGSIGVLGTIKKYRLISLNQQRRSLGNAIELVILGSLLTAFLSFALQRAPWGYSMIPFLGFLSLFAARGFVEGLVLLLGRVRPPNARKVLIGAAGAFLAASFIRSGLVMSPIAARDNTHQRRVLESANRLIGTEDSFYDNTGTIVSRPHAYFYFYTEKSIRVFKAEKLVLEVPAAIEKTGTTIMMVDARYNGLPQKLKSYLEENFQNYNGDLRIWGRRYHGLGEYEFNAILDGEYFIVPGPGSPEAGFNSIIAAGEIRIDGHEVQKQIFGLKKGLHKVIIYKQSDFYILWLPRDRKIWFPNPKAIRRFFQLPGHAVIDIKPKKRNI